MTQQTVKILTYNVQQTPVRSVRELALGVVDNRDNDNEIFDYDVICLQEVFWDPHRRIINKGFKKNGYDFRVKKAGKEVWDWIPFFGWLSQDSGLLFASRFPIKKWRKKFEKFLDPGRDTFDFVAEKGIFYTEVNIQDKKLFVFNTHLQAGDFAGIRKNQLNQIKSSIDRMVCKMIDIESLPVNEEGTEYIGNFSVVLTGDLNIDENEREEEYQDMRDNIFKNGEDLYRKFTDEPGFTKPDGDESRRLDYIYGFDYITIPDDKTTDNGIDRIKLNEVVVTEAKVVKRKFNGRDVSDHFGVGMTINV